MLTRTDEPKEVVSPDARERAWRTFRQGLGIDVGIAVVLVLVTAFADIQWTPEYWLALAASLGRTVLQSAVAYVFRIFVKPRVTGESREAGPVSDEDTEL